MDNVNIVAPYSGDPITLPIELFDRLSAGEADSFQEILMEIYFSNNPQILSDLIAVSENDETVLKTKREEAFQMAMEEDYSFEVELLKEMEDEIALMLAAKIDQ